jgi:isopenicillin-N N-acyltransferase-like protein
MVHPRIFTRLLTIVLMLSFITGCAILPKNSMSLYQRSMVIEDEKTELEILSKASVKKSENPAVNHIKVLYLKGTPYEMGFQHGRLLKKDVRKAVRHAMSLVSMLASFEAMDEAYDLIDPYIPLEEKEEMRGLAHGADLPLRLIHWLHTVPEVFEYRKQEKFSRKYDGTSCSNLAAFGRATTDGELVQLRVLDWARELGAQQWPVILVHQPDQGNASATFSYAGFIGCISGMNDQHMAFGEMGYGNPEEETLEGVPFVFLYRKLMRESNSIDDAVGIIRSVKRTCSYIYVISQAKSGSNKAMLIASNSRAVHLFKENQEIYDPQSQKTYPGLPDLVYGSAAGEKLYEILKDKHGSLSVENLKDVAVKIADTSNVQNVIFKPGTLEAWVTNAKGTKRDIEGRASNQEWFYFNFKDAVK